MTFLLFFHFLLLFIIKVIPIQTSTQIICDGKQVAPSRDWIQREAQFADVMVFGSVVETDKKEPAIVVSVLRTFKGPKYDGGILRIAYSRTEYFPCIDKVSKGDTKLFMAKTTAYNQWLNSDGISGLTKLELTSTPLDMDRSILEAIDSGAVLTDSSERYLSEATKLLDGKCGAEICHPLANCVSDAITLKSVCRCPECANVRYSPVCANDGVTYTNDCEVNRTACHLKADLKVIKGGFCDLPDPCNRLKCYHGATCESSPDKISARCVCPQKCPSTKGSAQTVLCGDNGKNYYSKCELERDMCPKQRTIKVKYENGCDPCADLERANQYPCARNLGGVCRLDMQRVPYCACSKDDIFECMAKDSRQLICTSEGKTMTRCQAAQDTCINQKNVSIIAPTACEVLQWASPVCAKKCRFFATCNITKERQHTCVCNFRCGEEFKPICGKDRNGNLVTYYNACQLKLAQCQSQQPIKTVFYGSCENYIPAFYACKGYSCPISRALECVVNENNKPECACKSSCPAQTFAPVCGSDMVTYDSTCELEAVKCRTGNSKLRVVLSTPCPDLCIGRECKFYGKCALVALNKTDCLCPELDCSLWPKNPFCGTDGRNYSSICELRKTSCANQVEIAVKQEGYCMPNLCDGFTCPYFGVCRSDSGKRSCNCIETCTAAKFDPVCSTQGITYPNLCSLKKEACDKQTDQIKLQNKGFCDQGFALSKCRERCEKPRECMVLQKTGQVECACKPCPSILNMNNGGGVSGLKVDLKQLAGGADMGQTICTESGASFSSLCDLQYAECVNNQTFKITTDSLVCDIKKSCSDKDSSLVYQDDFGETVYRCTNNSGCPMGTYCDRATCCSIKSWMIKVTPKCKESLFGCCKDNYSPSKGFNYEGCPEYCDCDPYGAYSDLCDDSGQCLCKPGVTGKRCNVCKPHFWGFEKSVYFTGCKHCVCERFGTDMERLELYEGCDKVTGNCPCKYPAKGQNCSTCPPGQTLMFMGCAQIDKISVITAISCDQCMFGSTCISTSTFTPATSVYDTSNKIQGNTPNSAARSVVPPQGKGDFVTCSCPDEASCSVSASTGLVCGSDGMTYTSRCHLMVKACRDQNYLHVVRERPCSALVNPCDYNPCPLTSVCVAVGSNPGFACLCPFGTEGSTCQLGAFIEIPSFSGLSYLMFPFQQLAIDKIELNFMARQPDGLLFLISSDNGVTENFIVIYLMQWQLRLKYVGNTETLEIVFDELVQLGSWVRFWFGFDGAAHQLNFGSEKESKIAPLQRDFALQVVLSRVAIGNLPSTYSDLTRKRIGEFIDIDSGFDGCISQLLINGVNTPLSYPSPMPVIQGLDVHSCTDNNPCDPQPCLNGGTCVAVENGGEFSCLCPKFFKGIKCEKLIDPCGDSKCKESFRSSACVAVEGNSYKCLCDLNVAGTFCNKKIDLDSSTVYMPEFFESGFMQRNISLPRSDSFEISMLFLLKSAPGLPTEAILLYNGRSADMLGVGDFFGISINFKAFVKVFWNYGSTIEYIRSSVPITSNRWNQLKILKNMTSVSLVLNGAISRKYASGPLRKVNVDEPLYVGGYPEYQELSFLNTTYPVTGFNGTIQQLSIDDELLIGNMSWKQVNEKMGLAYKVQQYLNHPCYKKPVSNISACMNGGLCLPIAEEYVCRCPQGFQGKHCETNRGTIPDWQSDSAAPSDNSGTLSLNETTAFLLAYPIEKKDQAFSVENVIEFSLRTSSVNGVIFSCSSNETTDYMMAELLDGFVHVKTNLGAGDFSLFSQFAINDDTWHQVIIKRVWQKVSLKVDNEPFIVTYGSTSAKELNTNGKVLFGYPEAAVVACSHNLGHNFRKNQHFVGCVKEIKLGETVVDIREPNSHKNCA